MTMLTSSVPIGSPRTLGPTAGAILLWAMGLSAGVDTVLAALIGPAGRDRVPAGGDGQIDQGAA